MGVEDQLEQICEAMQDLALDLKKVIREMGNESNEGESILPEDLLDEIIQLNDRIRDDIYTLEDQHRHLDDDIHDLDLIRDEREKEIHREEKADELEKKISRLMDVRDKLKLIQNDLYREMITSDDALDRLRNLNHEYMIRPYFSKTLEDVI